MTPLRIQRSRAHPVLFSAPMVRALLRGDKTETRRVLKPQPRGQAWFWPGDDVDPEPGWFDCWEADRDCQGAPAREGSDPIRLRWQTGDRLWVREAWRTLQKWDDLSPRHLPDDLDKIVYRAGPERNPLWAWGKSRPSIHMPRWTSRIALEVLAVRVERLQEVTEEAAEREGVRMTGKIYGEECENYRGPFCYLFSSLWNSINGRNHPWEANPWVTVTQFRVVAGATNA